MSLKNVFLWFFVLHASVFDSGGSERQQNKMDVFRLPNQTIPISYDLKIKPHYGETSEPIGYEGEVEIVISVKLNTSEITLNYKNLTVEIIYLCERDSLKSIEITDWLIDDQNERFTILIDDELDIDILYLLSIDFRGTIGGNMDGFYKSTYFDQNGYKEWLSLTYFEPTGARRMFPCYDEPTYKTPYNISLKVPQDKFVRSNMAESDNLDIRQGTWTKFAETPPMCTHMVAVVVSGFGRSPTDDRTSSGRGAAINVFARSDTSDQVRYVTDEAPRLLRAMEDFTGARYELPGLDLFAVPDFKSDAMGGWGLNTFREKYLLLNNMSSAKSIESGLSTVQREIARQWFGNLVTCHWWDYMWLHDAFTVYFQYFATHSVHPEWKMNETFVVEQHQQAMAYDQTARRPITASARTPEEINDAFYGPTSKKAASFLRMLKHVTNETIFQQSLVRYLKLNKYESVEPSELFAAFEHTVAEYQYDLGENVTVTGFMKQWTEQAGYPVIDVMKVSDTFVITQERFLIDTPDKTADPTEWPLGITYTTEDSQDFDDLTVVAWCTPSTDGCAVSAPREAGWFIFNVQSAGFYRVNYATDNWDLLIEQLTTTPTAIHVLNRAQLVDDSFNLARADKLHYSVPLRLSSYLSAEDDVLPWYSAIESYSYLLERMRRDDTEYSQLRECVSTLAGIMYKKIEDLVVVHKNADHGVLKSWNALSVWTCGLDNEICTRTAFDYYQKWQNGKNIPADIRDAAFCVGIHITNETSTWEQMFNFYKNTSSPSEKLSAQTALACTDDDSLLLRYLNYIFANEDGPIRVQDYKDVVIAVSSTPRGLNVLIEFLIQNLSDIIAQLTYGEDIAVFIYSICASKSALDSEIMRIKNLKNDPTTPENLREEFNESYRQVENNLYWYNKYHEIIDENTAKCSFMYTTSSPVYSNTTEATESTSSFTTEPYLFSSTSDIPEPNSTYSTSEEPSAYTQTPEEPTTEATYMSSEPSPVYSNTTEATESTSSFTTEPYLFSSTSDIPEPNTTYSTSEEPSAYTQTPEEPTTEATYMSSEPSPVYSNTTEATGSTSSFTTEPYLFSSTSDIPEPNSTYSTAEEPSAYTQTPEEPTSKTTYMSSESSPIYSTVTEETESSASSITTEPYIFSSTTFISEMASTDSTSEDPSASTQVPEEPTTETTYMSTKSSPIYGTATEETESASSITTEPHIFSSTTYTPSTHYTTKLTSTDTTTKVPATSSQSSEKPTEYSTYKSSTREPESSTHPPTQNSTKLTTITDQPEVTTFISTKSSTVYRTTTEQYLTTQYPDPESTTEHAPDHSQFYYKYFRFIYNYLFMFFVMLIVLIIIIVYFGRSPIKKKILKTF